MSKKTIYFIGECMVELKRSEGVMTYGFGGDTLNTAVYLSRLANPELIEVSYVSAIGTDSLSDEMVAMWEKEGIASQWVQRFPNKLPGMYLIETDPDGERRFHFWRNDSAARYWLQGPEASQVRNALVHAPMIYLSGISLAILSPEDRESLLTILAECRSHGGSIVFDNNYRPRLWESAGIAADIYRRVLALTDIALLTLDDEALVYGSEDIDDVLERTCALGVPEVVIKRGTLSCILKTNNLQTEVPSLVVSHVIDTTAAGDSFGAAYIATRLKGGSPVEAAHAGHRLAATVIGYRGAIIPVEAMPN